MHYNIHIISNGIDALGFGIITYLSLVQSGELANLMYGSGFSTIKSYIAYDC